MAEVNSGSSEAGGVCTSQARIPGRGATTAATEASCSVAEPRVIARMYVVEKVVTDVRQMTKEILQVFRSRMKSISCLAEVVFRSGRTIASLQADSRQHLVVYPGKDVLYCNVCVKDVEKTISMKSSPGLFRYDLSLEVEFSPKENLPGPFCSLNASVRKHFNSAHHKQMLRDDQERSMVRATPQAVAETIADRVLRLGYHATLTMLAKAQLPSADPVHWAAAVVASSSSNSDSVTELFENPSVASRLTRFLLSFIGLYSFKVIFYPGTEMLLLNFSDYSLGSI